MANVMLWQKAFILTPLWAIPLIPIAGFIARGFGHQGVQVGYGLVLCLLVTYFCEDLLKRRIRLDDE